MYICVLIHSLFSIHSFREHLYSFISFINCYIYASYTLLYYSLYTFISWTFASFVSLLIAFHIFPILYYTRSPLIAFFTRRSKPYFTCGVLLTPLKRNVYTVNLALAEGLCCSDFWHNYVEGILAKFHDCIYISEGNMATLSI